MGTWLVYWCEYNLRTTTLENFTSSNFEYIHGIPSSFCNIKKLFYVSTSGGPMSLEFGFNYVKTLAENFYGIKENILFKAEFLDLRNANVDDILTKAKEVINQYFEKEET